MEDIIKQLPAEATQVLRTYPQELHNRLPQEHADVLVNFFEEISKTEASICFIYICPPFNTFQVCQIVKDVLRKMEGTSPFHAQYGPEVLCVLLLACPVQLFGSLPINVRDDLASVCPFLANLRRVAFGVHEMISPIFGAKQATT